MSGERNQVSPERKREEEHLAETLDVVRANVETYGSEVSRMQADIDGIKCKMPNTVPVQWPNIVGVNLDTYRAAAYGAAAGNYAGCGCGYGTGFWN